MNTNLKHSIRVYSCSFVVPDQETSNAGYPPPARNGLLQSNHEIHRLIRIETGISNSADPWNSVLSMLTATAMDEESHLERIRLSAGNVTFLREYAHWLASRNDPRGEYLETELAFRDAEARIEELRAQMYELTVIRGLDMHWLDVVHPLHVTAITGGTFYLAPAPSDPPFVKLGDVLDPERIVGILEIGTIPNRIAARCAGYVSEIVAIDGQTVRQGDVLFRLVRMSPW